MNKTIVFKDAINDAWGMKWLIENKIKFISTDTPYEIIVDDKVLKILYRKGIVYTVIKQ